MGVRTYLPMLLVIARMFCKYVERHRAKLEANAPEGSYALIEVAYDACQAMEAAIGVLPMLP